MRKERVTKEEVLAVMRQQAITEPEEVDAVVLETEGSLSVMMRSAASREALSELGVKVDESMGRKVGVTE